MRLAKGAFLGFRRGPDTWIARYRGRDGATHHQALAGVQANDYDEAKRRAEQWLAQMGASGVRAVRHGTVRAALEAYLDDLERHGRHDAATAALSRFRLTVYRDRLADLELAHVTQDDFHTWRDRLLAGLGRSRGKAKRQPRSVNRYVNGVVGALNRALELGHIGNPRAWKLRRLFDERADEGTAVFLTPAQRKALIAAAEVHAQDFLRGLELTGARPH
jgi:hypothetical protein